MLQLESLCAAMKDPTGHNEDHAASTKTNAVKNKIKDKYMREERGESASVSHPGLTRHVI